MCHHSNVADHVLVLVQYVTSSSSKAQSNPMMTDCISLSPVISKAPIITSSPLKKPQYACKIALLEQLQKRHHNKRKMARSTAADIKIAEKKQSIHSKDNFSSYTFDMGMFSFSTLSFSAMSLHSVIKLVSGHSMMAEMMACMHDDHNYLVHNILAFRTA